MTSGPVTGCIRQIETDDVIACPWGTKVERRRLEAHEADETDGVVTVVIDTQVCEDEGVPTNSRLVVTETDAMDLAMVNAKAPSEVSFLIE